MLEIVSWPHQALETKAEVVREFDDALKCLSEEMHTTMDVAGGIGLAANQVNILKRVITIFIPLSQEDTPKKPWHDQAHSQLRPWHNKRYTFINPKMVKYSGKVTYLEGCLSFPGMMDNVDRHAEITVEYQDIHGHVQSLSCDGLMAICLQHEIDHINGVVFIERMDERVGRSIRERMLARA